MQVIISKALRDNYSYLLLDTLSRECLAVDPVHPQSLLAKVPPNVRLVGILTTVCVLPIVQDIGNLIHCYALNSTIILITLVAMLSSSRFNHIFACMVPKIYVSQASLTLFPTAQQLVLDKKFPSRPCQHRATPQAPYASLPLKNRALERRIKSTPSSLETRSLSLAVGASLKALPRTCIRTL